MIFDATVQAMAMELGPSATDEAGNPTADSHGVMLLVLGLGLPMGPQAAQIPAGVIRVPMGREMLMKFGKEALELGEKMPEPPKKSDLIIPDDPTASVDQAARLAQQFKAQ